MFKRVTLFILTNILVMATLMIVASVLGVDRYFTSSGLDYQSLAVFCLVWGMGGSLISLAMSRVMAKWMAGVSVINPQSPGEYTWLVQTVHQLARHAKISVMPEVGVYDSPEVNAFATGPTKNKSLVAVSTGLLHSMDKNQIEGVLGHEIAHIANGDMVTMTLLQGVVNAFVMFISRVAAYAIAQQVKEESRHTVNWIVTFVLQMVLGILGMIVVAWFSRYREFKADAGSAKYAGVSKMTSALQALLNTQSPALAMAAEEAPSLSVMKISSPLSKLGWLFSTHPPLQDRIKALNAPKLHSN